ncbi:MAG: type IV toxin-antitoxin system AbiEi family antitoxin domain-containing protein [Solirubrobacterales bacterium]|nr:type IV toxin-antitoxin system AbiEi family antitoxin domain-containing protein [Solirubrobacterales bacterium]
MPGVLRFEDAGRPQNASARAATVAGEQWGVIGRQQLHDCGISPRTVSRWMAAGKLHVIHHGVYAFGHASVPIEGRLVAALLHAGPGAVLSHATAAWWWGLVDKEPRRIESVARRGPDPRPGWSFTTRATSNGPATAASPSPRSPGCCSTSPQGHR